MKKLLVIFFCMFAAAANANTYIKNKQLIDWDNVGLNRSFLIMYMMGVSDVIEDRLACVPAGIEGLALYKSVMKYAKPKYLDPEESASGVIISALKVVYPCKKVPML